MARFFQNVLQCAEAFHYCATRQEKTLQPPGTAWFQNRLTGGNDIYNLASNYVGSRSGELPVFCQALLSESTVFSAVSIAAERDAGKAKGELARQHGGTERWHLSGTM
jgi:hypothetical protein